MSKIYKGILAALSIIGIISMNFLNVNAAVNDSNLVKSTYDNVYAVYDGPDRTHLFYAQRYLLNGRTAYCIEPGVAIDANVYSSTSDLSVAGLSTETLRYVRLAAYYGYDYTGHQTRNYFLAAQELMWERITGRSVRWVSELNVNGPEININNEKNEISNLIANHYKAPSFNTQTIEVNVGESKTLTDSNNVLSNYDIYSTNNATASINGNTLTIISNSSRSNGEVRLIRKTYTSQVTLIYYNGSNQKMISAGSLDPAIAAVNVNTIGGSITIDKQDSETGSVSLGDATLTGANYGVYNSNNELVDTLVSGTKNKSKDLPLGNYMIKEISASEGYELDTKEYHVELTKENQDPTMNVYEDIIKRDVTFFKVYASEKTGFLVGEKNVKFEAYLKSNNELFTTFTTNDKGYAEAELVYGTYIIKQVTTTKDHYKVDDFEITINKDSDKPFYQLMANAEIKAKLKVIKIDKDTGEVIKRSNIKFKIYDVINKKYVSQTITYPKAQTIDVFETDSNGILITPYVLNSGTYRLEEVDQKIDGYLWNKESVEFSIGENAELITDNEYGILFEVKFENKAVMGKVEIIKEGETVELTKDGYVYNKINLEGVKIGLYASEDIYDALGNLKYKKNSLVTELITNEEGYAYAENLYLGKYYLQEIETVAHHVLDSKKYNFNLEYKDQYTEIITYNTTLQNHLPSGKLVFSKTDFSTDEGLPLTLVEIYNEKDELVYSGRTDESGKIIIDRLPIGKYYILEKEAPEGYELNEEKMWFEVKEDGEVVKSNMKDKRIIEVPNTSANSYYIMIPLGIFLISSAILLFTKNKKNKKF